MSRFGKACHVDQVPPPLLCSVGRSAGLGAKVPKSPGFDGSPNELYMQPDTYGDVNTHGRTLGCVLEECWKVSIQAPSNSGFQRYHGTHLNITSVGANIDMIVWDNARSSSDNDRKSSVRGHSKISFIPRIFRGAHRIMTCQEGSKTLGNRFAVAMKEEWKSEYWMVLMISREGSIVEENMKIS